MQKVNKQVQGFLLMELDSQLESLKSRGFTFFFFSGLGMKEVMDSALCINGCVLSLSLPLIVFSVDKWVNVVCTLKKSYFMIWKIMRTITYNLPHLKKKKKEGDFPA